MDKSKSNKHLHGLAEGQGHRAPPNNHSLFTNRRGHIQSRVAQRRGYVLRNASLKRFRRCANVIDFVLTQT